MRSDGLMKSLIYLYFMCCGVFLNLKIYLYLFNFHLFNVGADSNSVTLDLFTIRTGYSNVVYPKCYSNTAHQRACILFYMIPGIKRYGTISLYRIQSSPYFS